MNKHIEHVGDPTFSKKCRNKHVRQAIIELYP
jgi:hypothetical protein